MLECHLVSYEDVRFPLAFEKWSADIDKEFNKQTCISNFDYCSNIALQTLFDTDPNTQVNKDIRYLMKFLRQHTQLHQYWLAYTEEYCIEQELSTIIALHLRNRKKFDYTVKMMSAAELTFRVNEKLLDFIVPNINIVVIDKSSD